jgi:uncharacterized coiled-coil protein SlyX
MDLSDWGRILAALNALPAMVTQIAAHESRLMSLENRMATEEATSARIDAVTNNLASDVSTIRTALADLRDAVASGDEAAISSAMDRVGPHIDTLETMETTLRGLPAEVPSGAPSTQSAAEISATAQSPESA